MDLSAAVKSPEPSGTLYIKSFDAIEVTGIIRQRLASIFSGISSRHHISYYDHRVDFNRDSHSVYIIHELAKTVVSHVRSSIDLGIVHLHHLAKKDTKAEISKEPPAFAEEKKSFSERHS